ncbi:hypothetical protein D3C81_1218230 [compost metagenome]
MGIGLIIISFIFLGLGIWSRVKPTWGWHMNVGWMVEEESEPSEAYIESMKFSGFISIVIGLIILAFGILRLFL